MTTSRYYMVRFAQAFGYFRKNQRMADAASEMHLLREAETQLGAALWEKVEEIEELSVEYWNLRKFVKERAIVQQKLTECQARLAQAHEERVTVLTTPPEYYQELVSQRNTLLAELEKIVERRDDIVLGAREVRRAYDGFKMKLEVITKESTGSESEREEIEKVKIRLSALKVKFAGLKKQRVEIGADILAGEAKVDVVDDQLKAQKQGRRVDASEAFQVIGDGNKEVSILRAENGLLDIQMRQLYAEIGRFVSRNANSHEGCAKVSRSHRGLVDVMRALRRSIALNHQLSGKG